MNPMSNKFSVDPDIRKASTLPSSFYKDRIVFEKIKEKIFLKSWQFIGDEAFGQITQISASICLAGSLFNRAHAAY